MRLRDVLEPAIFYAREGHPLVERETETIATVETLFREHWKTSAAIYLPDGKVPAPGTLFRNPTLAATYERLLKEAESAGATACARSRGRAKAGRAVLLQRRLMPSAAAWKRWIPAGCRIAACSRARTSRHGRRIAKRRSLTIMAASPSARRVLESGTGAAAAAALLKGFDLDGLDPAGADFIHLQVECAKLAFADRDSFYGDPASSRCRARCFCPMSTMMNVAG